VSDELAHIRQEFPGWHAWRSDAGRWWATRRGCIASDNGNRAWSMTIDADDVDGLRAALLQQEALGGDPRGTRRTPLRA
jgi:hypothetical protein